LKYFQSLRARLRRRKRIKAAKSITAPLREFVYLDEVSVYSLLASRQGALPTEYTHTETRSAADTFGSSFGATVGPVRTGTSSRSESSQSQSTQVLRKSSVQAAFRDLYLGEEDKLGLSPPPRGQDPPRIDSWADIEKGTGTAPFDNWIIDPAHLSRGELIEIEVELQAERIYRYSSIFTAMENIAEEGRAFFDAELRSQIRSIRSINSILNRLLVGLIPVKCRAVDYRITKISGRDFIIHKRLLSQLPDDDIPHCDDLYIVGVTEEASFWKDVRRILFSGSHYRIMCRLNHSDIRRSWVPVKLVDVLSEIAPSLARDIDQIDLRRDQLAQDDTEADDSHQRLMLAVVDFGIMLSENYGLTATPEDLLKEFSASISEVDPLDVEARRELFHRTANSISKQLSVTPDPIAVARLREKAILQSGLNLDGSVAENQEQVRQDDPTPGIGHENIVIDTEIVAIYW
jgi:hypothetical protein